MSDPTSNTGRHFQAWEAGSANRPPSQGAEMAGAFAFLVVFLGGLVGGIAFWKAALGSMVLWVCVLTLACVAAIGVWILVRRWTAPVVFSASDADRETESAKRIAEAKANGDFDRWDKK